jgi:CSLREA domain-containing protein
VNIAVRGRGLGASFLVVLAAFAGGLTGLVVAAGSAAATGPFVVNSVGDQQDASSNGVCLTSAGTCTLRAAIQEANFVAGHDSIQFAIPGTGLHEIAPTTRLPILTDPAGVTIDGYTQPGSAPNTDDHASNAVLTIQIRGTGAGGIDGIQTTAANTTFRGLAMYNFRRAIYLYGPGAFDNVVIGCFIGTNAAATFVSPTYTVGSSGVLIQAGAHNNIVGEPGDANRNVLSGNAHHGVATYDDATDNNVIQNNIIGLRPDGLSALGNLGHGVDINTWSSFTMIGGTGFQELNVVGGNQGEGIEISHGAGTLNNKIIGNYIGTNLTATAAPSYARNHQNGVNLEGIAECDASCPPDAGLNTVTNNVIVNSGGGGVMIEKAVHDSVVANNLIGVLSDGTPAPNAVWGVRIEKGSFTNTIGPNNVIAYNPNGIQLTPDGSSPPSPIQIPTYRNTFTRNSIHDSTGLGIDLYPLGSVTMTPGPLVNEGIQVPTITNAQSTSVTVSTCASCTVELFVASKAAGQFGAGVTYLATGVADGSGVATIPVTASPTPLPVTADTTNPAGDTSEFSKNVTLPAGTGLNAPPTAAFTSTCTLLACSFDASNSGDTDGSIVSYAWDFGDGTTGDTVVNPSLTYAADGHYVVSLTVTDDGGATGTVTHPVDVSSTTPPPALVDDGFDRTVAGGWGTAPTGGAWTVTSGPASDFSVGSSSGSVFLSTPGTGRGARLLGVSTQDIELETVISSSATPTGFGEMTSLVARRVANNREYRVLVRFASNGQVLLGVVKLLGTSTEVSVGPEVAVSGVSFAVGTRYRVRADFTGVSPTTITASLWVDGGTPPASPQLTQTDSEPTLQVPGSPGLHIALSSSATTIPVTIAIDSFTAH